MKNIQFPLARNTVQKDDINALCEWLQQDPTPKLTMGDLTKEFEEKAAKWTNRKYSVFVNSGSSANLLMAYALKVSNRLKNNKVVCANVGWVTTVAPFQQFGFEVSFCKTDPYNFGLDLNHLEDLCKEISPAVVIFVQPLGILVDKNVLLALQMKYGFVLLEDACAAVGSSYYDDVKAGKVGDMSSWSCFYGHQICTLGEGGLVFTDDRLLYNILVSLRSHGWMRNNDDDIYDGVFRHNNVDAFNQPFFFLYPGFNLRNTDVAAFVGLRQIDKLDKFTSVRNSNHRRYYENLKGKFVLQDITNTKIISSISFALSTNCSQSQSRRELVEKLNKNGVENRLYSAGSLAKHPFSDSIDKFNFHDSVGDSIHNYALFVPNNQEMTLRDVDNICNVMIFG